MKERWADLDEIVRRFHCGPGRVRARGLFTVRRGDGRLARLLAWALRLPAEGDDVPTLLLVEPESMAPGGAPAHSWTRTFGARTLSSRQYAWHDRLLAEQFRFIELRFRLNAKDGALWFEQVGAALAVGRARLAMPRWLRPRIDACVGPVPSGGGQMKVCVTISIAITGIVLAYGGCIRPEVAP